MNWIHKKLLSLFSRRFVSVLYRTMLGRDADVEGLSVYQAELKKTGDLSAVLAPLLASEEFAARYIRTNAQKITISAYSAILSRLPTQDEARAVQQFESDGWMEGLLRHLVDSDEHWHKTIEVRSDELITSIYGALLGRAPDARDLQTYRQEIVKRQDLGPVMAAVAGSDEHWQRLWWSHSPEVLKEIYGALLDRDVDSEGYKSYTNSLREQRGLQHVLSSISDSQEFRSRMGTFPGTLERPLVFLHIHKTGGTSLQNMLKDLLGKRALCEHKNSLEIRASSDLNQFIVFAGHYNFDSLQFLPTESFDVITILRDPKKRLFSLYNFWKAHKPSAADWSEGMKLANELSADEFFAQMALEKPSDLWNHMTWAVMGQSRWEQWREQLELVSCPNLRNDFLVREVQPSIKRRLGEFKVVGFHNDFENSVNLIFQNVGLPPFRQVRHDHSLEKLTEENFHFKKINPTYESDSTLTGSVDWLVELDNILYREAELAFRLDVGIER